MGQRGVKLFLGHAQSGDTVGTIGTGKMALKVSLVVTPVPTVF